MSSLPVPRPGIMDVAPYVGGEGKVAGAARLASNENPLGCSPKAREAYLKAAEELHRYPDGSASALRVAIGKAYGLDPARIVCGAGSDELIALLNRCYAGAGDEVLCSQHGFLKYPIDARAAGATPVFAPEKNLRTDVAALLKAVTPKTKIVFIANPNNPTGSWLTGAELKDLRGGLPGHVLLVIDSAYAEFVREKDYADGSALVDAHPNVAMLRTFSKVYGLAALRLGWGYFSPAVADALNRIRGPFNVSLPAQMAGIAALEDKAFVEKTAKLTEEGRAYLSEKLSALGVKPSPSVGNFILAHFGPGAESIRAALNDKGVFIRQMGVYGLPEYLRITIGLPEDNARLVRELEKILK